MASPNKDRMKHQLVFLLTCVASTFRSFWFCFLLLASIYGYIHTPGSILIYFLRGRSHYNFIVTSIRLHGPEAQVLKVNLDATR